jgi:hypothetical protein
VKEVAMNKSLSLLALVLALSSLAGCRTAFMAEPAPLCCPSGSQSSQRPSGHCLGGNNAAPAPIAAAPACSYERTETETTTEGVVLPDGSTRSTTLRHLKVEGELGFARYDRAMRGEEGTLQSDPSLRPSSRRDDPPPPVEQQLQPLRYRSGGRTPFGGDYFGD